MMLFLKPALERLDFKLNNKSNAKHLALYCLFFLAISFLAYHPALKNGFIWDDDQYITENQNLRSLKGLKDTWFEPKSLPQYYPLTHTMFWIEYQLWGPNAYVYHFNNIVLHALCAFMLWLILSRLKIPGAFLAAAVFAIHPIHTESVAWATERKNTLSGLLYLSALYAYLHVLGCTAFSGIKRDKVSKSDQSDSYRSHYLFSLILFVGALLSKSVTATLPVVVLVLIWWQNGSVKKRDVLLLAPFFILGIGFGLSTAWLETSHVGAHGQDFDFNFLDRCLIAGRALWFYLYKLVWPKDLIFIYPRWQIDATKWWLYLYPLSFLLMFACFFIYRNRIGRGAFASLLIFASTLFPALGFINVYPHRFSFVADHFQYLASIAIITAIASLISRISRNVFTTPNKKLVFNLIVVLLLFNLGLATAGQSFSYRDRVSLWENTISKNQSSWLAYNNLGAAYVVQKQYRKAIDAGFKALKINPNTERAHAVIAKSYFYLSDFEAAINYNQKLIDLYIDRSGPEPWSIKLVLPYNYLDLATIYMLRKDYKTSEKYISMALALKPDFPMAYGKLGKLYALQGKHTDAISNYQKALHGITDNAKLYHDIGESLFLTGKFEQAALYFQKALDITPNYVDAKTKLEETRQKLPVNRREPNQMRNNRVQ